MFFLWKSNESNASRKFPMFITLNRWKNPEYLCMNKVVLYLHWSPKSLWDHWKVFSDTFMSSESLFEMLRFHLQFQFNVTYIPWVTVVFQQNPLSKHKLLIRCFVYVCRADNMPRNCNCIQCILYTIVGFCALCYVILCNSFETISGNFRQKLLELNVLIRNSRWVHKKIVKILFLYFDSMVFWYL